MTLQKEAMICDNLKNDIYELVEKTPKLKYNSLTNSEWKTIEYEGLNDEFNLPHRKQWKIAILPISKKDKQCLMLLHKNAIEKFNRFDINLKKRYKLRYIDLIDYQTVIIRIVKPKN